MSKEKAGIRHPSSVSDACGQAAFETALSTAEFWCPREQQAFFPRFARYFATLSRLPRRARRQLQQQWRRPLAAIAVLLTLGQAPPLAATLNVGGSCTLIDAITAANSDIATGGCPAGSGADTIVLPPSSTQTLTAINNSADGSGPTGLPVISSSISIEGNGSTILRDAGAPEFRIFKVDSMGNLTLINTTVSGGITPVHVANVYSGGGIVALSAARIPFPDLLPRLAEITATRAPLFLSDGKGHSSEECETAPKLVP